MRTAQQLASKALTSDSPLAKQISDQLATADELVSDSQVDLEALEEAERAAAQALRSMEKFLGNRRSVAAQNAPTVSPQANRRNDD